MAGILVAYFSASGVTARLAQTLAAVLRADMHQIKPAQPYTSADLNWNDQQSRSSIEMKDYTSRPAIANRVENMGQYATIFLGFPIWWYRAPAIINTFLEQYDLAGKAIIPFATSGGSGMGDTNVHLQPSCPGAVLKNGAVLRVGTSAADLKSWAEGAL